MTTGCPVYHAFELNRQFLTFLPASPFMNGYEPRKKSNFFDGEVFFLLTRPLMDDPYPSHYSDLLNTLCLMSSSAKNAGLDPFPPKIL